MPKFKPRNTKRARSLRNTATPAERLLWRRLSGSRLGVKFTRQMPIGPWFADFLCRSLGLVIEIDGFSHELTPQRDAARDIWMKARVYCVLRSSNEDVMRNTEGVLMEIARTVEALRQVAGAGPPRCD
jgi:BirA family biotin operon repressor/biotin-[acetyl-CoA-carboxylase] ligase